MMSRERAHEGARDPEAGVVGEAMAMEDERLQRCGGQVLSAIERALVWPWVMEGQTGPSGRLFKPTTLSLGRLMRQWLFRDGTHDLHSPGIPRWLRKKQAVSGRSFLQVNQK